MSKAKTAAGGAAAIAILSIYLWSKRKPKRTAIVTIEDEPAGGWDITYSPFVYAPATVSVPQSGKLTPEQALQLATDFNNQYFGGWFSQGGRSLALVVAVWTQESRLGALPRNPNDHGGGAWGIGHVLATTAADRGFTNPLDLLRHDVGARASMEHLRWLWDELTRLQDGRAPTNAQWIASYNAGAWGVAKLGRTGAAYLGAVKNWLSDGVKGLLG